MYKNRHVSVIIPALNEAPSIANVINGLSELNICKKCFKVVKRNDENSIEASGRSQEFLTKVSQHESTKDIFCADDCTGSPTAVVDQIIVGNNGSTDETAAIARSCGALVVEEPERGYGAACLAALNTPHEKDLIVFVDGDHSVAAIELPSLLLPLVSGADLVIGSRTLGHSEKGALSLPQEFGNRFAIALMRILWRGNLTDLGPFRSITQSALTTLKMSDRKFGWTVEMQIRAHQEKLTTVEIPVSTKRRVGKSKISGTVKGVIGAAHGILGTIAKLYWRQLAGTYKSNTKKVTFESAPTLSDKPENTQ